MPHLTVLAHLLTVRYICFALIYIINICVITVSENTIQDLVLSCQIQALSDQLTEQ